jgi:hypothetical protein
MSLNSVEPFTGSTVRRRVVYTVPELLAVTNESSLPENRQLPYEVYLAPGDYILPYDQHVVLRGNIKLFGTRDDNDLPTPDDDEKLDVFLFRTDTRPNNRPLLQTTGTSRVEIHHMVFQYGNALLGDATGGVTNGYGGGLIINGTVHIYDSRIANNQAGGGGGGIVSISSLSLTRVVVHTNQAGAGGGIQVESGSFYASCSRFVANQAITGSAVLNVRTASTRIWETLFRINLLLPWPADLPLPREEGVVYNLMDAGPTQTSDVWITQSQFQDNQGADLDETGPGVSATRFVRYDDRPYDWVACDYTRPPLLSEKCQSTGGPLIGGICTPPPDECPTQPLSAFGFQAFDANSPQLAPVCQVVCIEYCRRGIDSQVGIIVESDPLYGSLDCNTIPDVASKNDCLTLLGYSTLLKECVSKPNTISVQFCNTTGSRPTWYPDVIQAIAEGVTQVLQKFASYGIYKDIFAGVNRYVSFYLSDQKGPAAMYTTGSTSSIVIYQNGYGFANGTQLITKYLVSHELMHIFTWTTGGYAVSYGTYAVGAGFNTIAPFGISPEGLDAIDGTRPFRSFYDPDNGVYNVLPYSMNNWTLAGWNREQTTIEGIEGNEEIVAEMLNIRVWQGTVSDFRPDIILGYQSASPIGSLILAYIDNRMPYWVSLAINQACDLDAANPSISCPPPPSECSMVTFRDQPETCQYQ